MVSGRLQMWTWKMRCTKNTRVNVSASARSISRYMAAVDAKKFSQPWGYPPKSEKTCPRPGRTAMQNFTPIGKAPAEKSVTVHNEWKTQQAYVTDDRQTTDGFAIGRTRSHVRVIKTFSTFSLQFPFGSITRCQKFTGRTASYKFPCCWRPLTARAVIKGFVTRHDSTPLSTKKLRRSFFRARCSCEQRLFFYRNKFWRMRDKR